MRCPDCNDFGFYTATYSDGTSEGRKCHCSNSGKTLEQDKDNMEVDGADRLEFGTSNTSSTWNFCRSWLGNWFGLR